MADIVVNTGAEFKTYIYFVTSPSALPFCIDTWVTKLKLEGGDGLLRREGHPRPYHIFYNSLTV